MSKYYYKCIQTFVDLKILLVGFVCECLLVKTLQLSHQPSNKLQDLVWIRLWICDHSSLRYVERDISPSTVYTQEMM